ncbi:M23 family metallopeptidase [Nostocoides sp. HKS02]|uniref:M23 family metallopeptidase n=1 Tax=Nostocoides sp. HKS02 TaxID=1813880 RepID=UPI0012B47864|nr:M23 family metallopeptidase [Tetrasphaera sp. HKS02]QGN56554.1 peptidoglycan DD-metalloendopeptidase family protein [Tetrasphaera sp. HKS02]
MVTATGATVAESAPAYFDVTGSASRARAMDAAATQFDRMETEQQRELQNSTALGRVSEAQRVARSAQRSSVASKGLAVAALKKAEAARQATEAWVLPIKGATFTSGFGWRWGRMHEGNDFATPVGTPIAAMSTGTVISTGWENGYGNKVSIQYWDGTVSVYAHMSEIDTTVGAKVAPGKIVGLSGNTGHLTGPHLHLEIHPYGGAAINPAPGCTPTTCSSRTRHPTGRRSRPQSWPQSLLRSWPQSFSSGA